MASLLRPTAFRQACNTAPTARFLSTRASPRASSTLLPLRNAQPASPLLQQTFTRTALSGSTRIAAFQTSAKRDILPPLPQRIQGTSNEAAPVPTPNSTHGGYHWTFERLVAVSLVPLTVAPFIGGSLNPVLDASFCALLIAHSHVGFQSCIIDYFPKKRVPKTRTSAEWLLRITTLLTAVGLYEFETNDVGVTEAVKRIWKA